MNDSKIACITLDLEPDHAGIARRESYNAFNEKKLKYLLGLLNKYNVNLSVFAVGKTLKKSNAFKIFQKYNVEFNLHSYSHNLNSPDSESEITKGIKIFKEVLKQKPLGYRAPRGLISNSGLVNLKKYGFKFDSSLIPSFWPALKYLKYDNKPHKTRSGLIEIPFSVITPLKLVFCLSWIKLLGWKIYKLYFDLIKQPEQLVFAFHLHDVWRTPAYDNLPVIWKLIYRRNHSNGLKILESVVVYLKANNYKFVTVGYLADRILKKDIKNG
jgi:hypothetical protein